MRKCIVMIGAVLTLSGSGILAQDKKDREPEGNGGELNYFPLRKGAKWVYRAVTTDGKSVERMEVVVEKKIVVDHQYLDGKRPQP